MGSKRKRKKSFDSFDGITLMVIPHNEKHVFEVKLSYRVLYFIVFLILSVASFAALSYYTIDDFYTQEEDVSEITNAWNNKLWLFKHGEKTLQSRLLFLTKTGKRFHKFIWPKVDVAIEKPMVVDSDIISSYTSELSSSLSFLALREDTLRSLPMGWPVKSGYISSPYGSRSSAFALNSEFHPGYDFANATGTPIYATADGKVLTAGGMEGGYGIHVKILHKHGFITLYGHCSKVLVEKDQMVKRGDKISLLGRTGNATGPHIHYEVRLKDADPKKTYELFINPWHFIKESI